MSISGSFEQQLCFLYGINLLAQDLINPKKTSMKEKSNELAEEEQDFQEHQEQEDLEKN